MLVDFGLIFFTVAKRMQNFKNNNAIYAILYNYATRFGIPASIFDLCNEVELSICKVVNLSGGRQKDCKDLQFFILS